MEEQNHRTQLVVSYLIVGTMLVTLCLCIYWLLWPINVIDIRDVKVITQPPVYPGDLVSMEFTYDKYYPLTGDITKGLIKQDSPHCGLSVTVIASTKSGHLPMGLNKQAIISFIIPLTTPPGVYTVHTVARYQINPLREFYEEWTSPPITVEPLRY